MQKAAPSPAPAQAKSDASSGGGVAPVTRAWAPGHELLTLQRSLGNRAVNRLLNGADDGSPPPGRNELSIAARSDPAEREAEGVAARVSGGRDAGQPVIRRASAGSADARRAAPPSVERAITGSGRPLTPSVRTTMEQHFGRDFSHVRVHTDADAHESAKDIRAHAYTAGNHIVFGNGRFAPETPTGRRLLAHELTHVVQQSGSRGVVARESQDDADAHVSLGVIDNSYVGEAGEAVLGHSQWLVLREFLRGLWAGLQSVPPDQLKRIDDKMKDFGYVNAAKYVGGYALGIIAGVWTSIKGLVEAIITLITLPYEIGKFIAETVPDVAARYGPRIARLLTEEGGLSKRIDTAVTNFIKEPRKSLRQISGFLDAIGTLALSKVRALGRGAAGKVLAYFEEKWFDYGFDTGKVVGQILFEVILLVASDAIANIVKEALSVVARLSARVAAGAVQLVKSAGRIIAGAIEWVSSVGRKAAGELGEMFEGVRKFLSEMRALLTELGEESALADTGAGTVRVATTDAKAGVLESRAVQPPTRTSPATVADLKPPKVHPSNVADDAASAASRTKPPVLQYRDNLVKRFPKLDGAELKPMHRGPGPGMWEESMYTGSGKQSWTARLRDGRGIQLDDIDRAGNLVDTKMRGIDFGREIPPARVPDVVEQMGGSKAGRVFDSFPEGEQDKLLRQLRFCQENGLKGVRWETNSAELKAAVERYAQNFLSKEEQRLVKIVLVER